MSKKAQKKSAKVSPLPKMMENLQDVDGPHTMYIFYVGHLSFVRCANKSYMHRPIRAFIVRLAILYIMRTCLFKYIVKINSKKSKIFR